MSDLERETLQECEDRCLEMYQECINEIDPDFPAGYAQCQLLHEACLKKCKDAFIGDSKPSDGIVE